MSLNVLFSVRCSTVVSPPLSSLVPRICQGQTGVTLSLSVMSKFSFLPVEGNETLCGRTAVSLCSKARIMTAVLLEGSHLVFAVCWSSLRLSLLRDSGPLVNLTLGKSRAPITANAPIIEDRSLNSIVERTRLADSKVIVRNSTAERGLDWGEHSDSVKR